MARSPHLRPEDVDEALGKLAHARGRRAAIAAQRATILTGLETTERQLVELDEEIKQRAAALKAAHGRADLFDFLMKPPA